MGTQPKSHTPHAGSGTETDLEACARLIPLLSALPGHPTRAPTGCQPPPPGRQGQPGMATGRAPGKQRPPASAGSSPGPVPGASSPLSMRRGGTGLPVPSLTHGHGPEHGRAWPGLALPLPLRSLPGCQARHRLAGAQGSGQHWHSPRPWVLAAQGCARRSLCGSGDARPAAAPR